MPKATQKDRRQVADKLLHKYLLILSIQRKDTYIDFVSHK